MSRKLRIALLWSYVFLMIASTVLTRKEGQEWQYNIRPFWTYFELAKGTWRANRLLEQLLLNIVMFIPISFLFASLINERGFVRILIICAGISVIIEILQLITKRGLSEFDDIFHNTVGGLIGYGIYHLFDIIKKRWNKE